MKPGDLVEVHWRDSHQHDGPWITARDLRRKCAAEGLLDCVSVGYVFALDEDTVTIITSDARGLEGEDAEARPVGGAWSMPREAITKVVHLSRRYTRRAA